MKISYKYKIVIYITGLLVIIGTLLVLGGVFNEVLGQSIPQYQVSVINGHYLIFNYPPYPEEDRQRQENFKGIYPDGINLSSGGFYTNVYLKGNGLDLEFFYSAEGWGNGNYYTITAEFTGSEFINNGYFIVRRLSKNNWTTLETGLSIPFVWGATPDSGTIITDLNSILTIRYEGLESWDSLYINLRNLETGINTDTRYFKVSEIGSSGELEINLWDFGIKKNANWYLYANAVYEGYIYESGFLKGTGYTWSDDLTDGDYYLTVNATELQDMFVMEGFDSWYINNVDKFDDPTAMFSAIAEFFQPIFTAIGEYGNSITNYFDLENSYIKGFEIGKIMPVFNYYLGEISLFLGGFPLIKWFFIVSFILIGIFIFKLIFKFIPFLG